MTLRDEHPLITVGIPTYSRLEYLKTAVDSARAQTYRNIEVLISLDPMPTGPNQAIKAWCEHLCETDDRVSFQINERNLGLGGNWNAIADAAKGQYVVVIGDDDRLLPDFVERLLAQAPSGCNVIFSNHFIIDGDGVRDQALTDQFTTQYGRSMLAAGALQNPSSVAWSNSIPMTSALIRTEDFRRLRVKDALNNPEIELFIRLSDEPASTFCFVPAYLAEYRVHGQMETGQGLRNDLLAQFLVGLPVSKQAEPHKARFMASILPNAVSRRLVAGDTAGARSLYFDGYYPRTDIFSLKGLARFLLLFVPAAAVKPVMKRLGPV